MTEKHNYSMILISIKMDVFPIGDGNVSAIHYCLHQVAQKLKFCSVMYILLCAYETHFCESLKIEFCEPQHSSTWKQAYSLKKW